MNTYTNIYYEYDDGISYLGCVQPLPFYFKISLVLRCEFREE